VYRRNMLSLILLAGGLLALTGCKGGVVSRPLASGKASTNTTTAKKAGPETGGGDAGVVTAAQLCDDYNSGEATADSRYKNKDIQVQGTVRSVRKDNKTGEPMLELRGTTDAKSGSRAVRCYFAAAEADAVSKLKKDYEVKVSGTCQGKQGSGENFDVLLKNCKLVK